MAAGVAGLILAGGAGTRYGGPKAFARLPDGRTFLAACATLLREGGAGPLLATLPPGTPVLRSDLLETVTLDRPGLPMFDSLRVGLGRLLEDRGWEAVVVVPVDHPLVAPTTVRTLAAARAEAAIASFRGKHGHPVLLARSVAEAIVAGRHAGPTLREVLRDAGAVDVDVDDPGVTANCNTPEALAAALATPNSPRTA